MKRVERLRAASDFAAVRAHGRALHSATVTLSWLATTGASNRFGFVVSKRVGNAVTRNLVKRRLRAIMDARKGLLLTNFDIVLLARPSAAQRPFAELTHDVERLLRRAHLLRPLSSAEAGIASNPTVPSSASPSE